MPPVSPTYPGVYIEEIPSGNRTIVGVQTSITAFVGRTVAGPLDKPIDCFNYADFESHFGGRSFSLPLTYAVEDFFLNGGSHAIVVRVATNDASAAKFTLPDGTPPISAIGPGDWGNHLTIAFDHLGLRTPTPAKAAAATIAVGGTATADGTIVYTPAVTTVLSTPYTKGEDAKAIATALATALSTLPGTTATAAAAVVTVKHTGGNDKLTAALTARTVPAGGNGVTLTVAGDAGSAAGATITVGGPATDAGTIESDLTITTAATPATVQYASGDKAAAVAANLAKALSAVAGITATVASDVVTVTVSSPGSAGNNVKLTATTAPTAGITVTPTGDITLEGGADAGGDNGPAVIAAAPYAHYGVQADDLFNVTVTYTPPGKGKQPVTERYTGVSVTGDQSPTRIDRVINPQSLLVAVNPDKSPWNFGGYDTTASPVPFGEPFIASPGHTTPPAIPARSASGGTDSAVLDEAHFLGDELARTGMYALENTDLFNLLCIPPDTRVDEGGTGGDPNIAVYGPAAEFCANRRAMLICDPPRAWYDLAKSGQYSLITPTDMGVGDEKGGRNAAVFFPFIKKADPELNGKVEVFAPSGSVAGQFAETDLTRGVWKAPAGMATGLEGVTEAEIKMTDDQNGQLNPLGINAIRSFPIIGTILWGSRTLRGADVFADDYKYIPVRRLTLFIEESLYRGTKWAVFEPNDDKLWSSLRLSVGTFMADLSRQGAFYGYSVQCDKSTTLQSDIDLGIVNVVVAFAPVKPAEFVILKIAQQAGQTPG